MEKDEGLEHKSHTYDDFYGIQESLMASAEVYLTYK